MLLPSTTTIIMAAISLILGTTVTTIIRTTCGRIITTKPFITLTKNQSYYVPPVRPNAPLEQAPPPPELVTFGAFSHCKDLANRLDLLANELCLDLHYNYPHNRGFKETYREAYAILQLAKFVQGSDLPSNRDKLRESLQGLDRQFHHVQVDVKGWSRIHARQIGSLGIIEKTDQLESIIHHLLYDVGIEPQHDGPHVTTPGVREEAPPPQ